MNIIQKVTWKCMKAAKRRTMVTIFGVILSVAMIAAVSTIAQSFQDLMLRNARSNFGDFEMEFYDVPAKQAEKLVKDSRIKGKSDFLSRYLCILEGCKGCAATIYTASGL